VSRSPPYLRIQGANSTQYSPGGARQFRKGNGQRSIRRPALRAGQLDRDHTVPVRMFDLVRPHHVLGYRESYLAINCTRTSALSCLIDVLFQGLNDDASAVFRYIGFLFLSIYVAESQVLVVAALLPIFVAALAVSAFLNGFWMSVGGYL
jgi:hypothetical protein